MPQWVALIGALAIVPTPAHGHTRPHPTDSPRIVDVHEDPGNGATMTLTVTLDQAAPVEVTFGPSEGDVRFQMTDRDSLLTHALVLSHLPATTEHAYSVVAGTDTVRGRFTTLPLPSELQGTNAGSSGRPTHPLTLLETGQRPGFRGLVALDGAGDVVWYCDIGGIVHGVVRRRVGTWALIDPTYGIREIDATCNTLTGRPRTPGRTIHHDLVESPDGSILYLARERRMVGGDSLTGEFIRRWTPETGADEEVWSSFEHLDPGRDWSERSRPRNWLHANSLALGPRGNAIVSLAHLDQVISIAPDFSGIEWRMGGPNATHPIVEGLPFSGQHTATEIAPGRVLLFDNGLARDEPWSRAVEYELRPDGAHEVWSFRPPTDNWSRVMGSARRLANGNTLVDFGAGERQNGSSGPIEIYEVTPSGEVVWHFVVGDRFEMVYRATPITTIGGEMPVGR